jgi:hypothetical protein
MLSNLQTWTIVGLIAIVWLPLSLLGVAAGGPICSSLAIRPSRSGTHPGLGF